MPCCIHTIEHCLLGDKSGGPHVTIRSQETRLAPYFLSHLKGYLRPFNSGRRRIGVQSGVPKYSSLFLEVTRGRGRTEKVCLFTVELRTSCVSTSTCNSAVFLSLRATAPLPLCASPRLFPSAFLQMFLPPLLLPFSPPFSLRSRCTLWCSLFHAKTTLLPQFSIQQLASRCSQIWVSAARQITKVYVCSEI